MKKTLSKISKLHDKKKKFSQDVAKKPTIQKLNKLKDKVNNKVKAKDKIIATTKTKVKTKAKIKTKPTATVSLPKDYKPIEKLAPIKPASITREKNMFGPTNFQPYKLEKKEEYMNQKQLEHFRTVLLKWKDQLMTEVDRTMHNMQNGVSNYPDPVDRASQEEEFSLELRARDRERKLLRKIEETLTRITDEDYGYCDDCGAEIGIRRLEARPTATQCIECKTIAEIREKQVGEGG